MTMLLVLLSPALATPVVVTGAECDNHYVVGVNGYKDVMAHQDPDDPGTMGKWGLKADDTLWTANPATPYADGSAKECRGHHGPCEWKDTDPLTMTNKYMAVTTCAVLRFGMNESSPSDTVYLMKNLDTFTACDFADAVQINDGGTLKTGEKFIEFPFDHDSIDKQYFFASQNNCNAGQKVAVTVVETLGKSYESGLKEGKQTARIQHCDCDHSINSDMDGSEAFHKGFVEGCKSEMPEDLSCCPGSDVKKRTNVKYSKPYLNGGSCIRKSDQKYYMEVAKELSEKCTNPANKAECDEYLKGYTCPWYRVYNMGGWVFNTDIDGTDQCAGPGECTGIHDTKYHAVKALCTTSSGCQVCNKITTRYHGRCDGGWRYSCASMFDEPQNWGCDGANSTYTPHCDMWFMAKHCEAFETGTPLTPADDKANATILKDIGEEQCGNSRYVNAYQTYTGDATKWDAWLESFDAKSSSTSDDVSLTAPVSIGLMLAALAWK
jgi:hypothetical protein